MAVAKRNEILRRAALVERTGGLERRHQDTLFGVQDLGGFTHEAHAGDHQCGGRMIMPEARHVQGIRYITPGLFGQRLQIGICVIVSDEHRIFLLQ